LLRTPEFSWWWVSDCNFNSTTLVLRLVSNMGVMTKTHVAGRVVVVVDPAVQTNLAKPDQKSK